MSGGNNNAVIVIVLGLAAAAAYWFFSQQQSSSGSTGASSGGTGSTAPPVIAPTTGSADNGTGGTSQAQQTTTPSQAQQTTTPTPISQSAAELFQTSPTGSVASNTAAIISNKFGPGATVTSTDNPAQYQVTTSSGLNELVQEPGTLTSAQETQSEIANAKQAIAQLPQLNVPGTALYNLAHSTGAN